MAQFVEHDRSEGRFDYINLDQIVVARYETIGVRTPLLTLYFPDGSRRELAGKTAEELASVLSTNTVARLDSQP